MQITQHRYFLSLLMMVIVMASMSLAPSRAYAADPQPVGSTTEKCTNFKKLAIDAADDKKPGILTSISTMIKGVINDASKNLYEAFIKNSGYTAAINAAVTLMITIYAAAFMIGVVQPSFGDVLRRLIKIGVIYAMISPTGWEFFSQYAVKFFNDGTDQIIGGVIEIGTGQKYTSGESPFKQLDELSKWIISPDMIIAVIGTITAKGPYSLAMGGLLGFAFGGVIQLLIGALKNYALCFILRAMLLGVAPLFIVFLLFDKTKNLFMGWLNMLINLSLQPILYFTFLSLFVVMILGASKDMLGHGDSPTSSSSSTSDGTSTSSDTKKEEDKKGIDFCWMETQIVSGTTNKTSSWVIKVDGQLQTGSANWKGGIDCLLGADKSKCAEFPINIVDLLSFLILIYVATRFVGVVDNLAGEISNTMINVDAAMKQDVLNDMRTKQSAVKENAGGATTKKG